jgi:hypothetical protein
MQKDTAHLSREHVIVVSRRGLVTITGGKWTTYRRDGRRNCGPSAAGGWPTPPPFTHPYACAYTVLHDALTLADPWYRLRQR